MSNPTPVTPHILSHTFAPSTGFGVSPEFTQANAVDFGTTPVRSSGRITTASAEAARNDAMRRIQRDRTSRRVFTGA